MSINNPYQNTGIGSAFGLGGGQVLQGTTTSGLYTGPLHQGYTQQPAYHPLPARNAVTERTALAVYRKRMNLGQVAKDMPGNYDKNRKLLGDIFLTDQVKMTQCEAASLAFVLHEEVGSFLDDCERVGIILPGEQ